MQLATLQVYSTLADKLQNTIIAKKPEMQK